jgi:hypothetical protein
VPGQLTLPDTGDPGGGDPDTDDTDTGEVSA